MPLAQKRYAENALIIDGTGAQIEEGSVSIDNEHVKNFEKSGHKFAPDSEIIYSTRNFIDFTLFQPLFQAVTELTSIQINWKLFNECGSAPTTGKNISLTKACLVPQSLTADKISAFKLACRVYSLFDGGNGMSQPVDGLATPVKMTDPYFLDSVTIGGAEVTSLKQITANFGHTVQWPDEFEPEELWVSESAETGTINTENLDEATITRLQSLQVADIVYSMKNKAGNTQPFSFTNCSIMCTVSGAAVAINWSKLTD